MWIISDRLWQATGSENVYAVKIDRANSSETQAALLDVSATDPRWWRLIDRRDGHEIRAWRFSNDWRQTWLHERLDTNGCNALIVTPESYMR